ncbi:TadG family pilus assembly protein [Variovorax sp. V59]|uniref:TadG family pilus assembly protein n=1 Tax=unclassified Variovorax TaxID=663243 RepID=UPI0034E93C5B
MNPKLNALRNRSNSSSPLKVQHGSLLVNLAIALSLIVIVLIGTELGYLFFMKRELQKSADLAALAGAQQISVAGGCANAITAAKLSANGASNTDPSRNLPPTFMLVDGDIECGQWDPAKTTIDHFEPAASNLNAVRVTISKAPIAILPFFDADRTIRAKAVAANDPIASFSLGTGVAGLNEGAVNQLLSALLGTGNKISLRLVDYQGLASAQIRLLDLITVIPNVGTVDELLNTRIQLNDLMLAMVQALGTSNTLAVQALNSIISTNVKSAEVRLGDLIKVTTPSSEGAASAAINVLDLLTTSAQIANGKNLVKLGTAIDLGALAKADVQLVVVEPPSIAIGPAGKDGQGNWRTQAHSAAVRMRLDVTLVDTNEIPGLSWLVKVTLLRLPIYIEVAQGNARLSNIQCANDRADCRVAIEAKPGLASICIASVSDTLMLNTTVPVDCKAMPSVKISEIALIGGLLPILQVNAKIPVQAEIPDTNYQTLTFNGVIGDGDDIQTVNSNAVGSVLSNTLGNFTAATKWDLTLVALGILPLGLGDVLSPLLAFVLSILAPLFSLLDAIIVPLLNLLGVQLGYADVRLLSLLCGEAKLVY